MPACLPEDSATFRKRVAARMAKTWGGGVRTLLTWPGPSLCAFLGGSVASAPHTSREQQSLDALHDEHILGPPHRVFLERAGRLQLFVLLVGAEMGEGTYPADSPEIYPEFCRREDPLDLGDELWQLGRKFRMPIGRP